MLATWIDDGVPCATLLSMAPASSHSGPDLFVPVDDGRRIATYDFGGSGTPLLLVHATGFCAEVLRPMADALSDHFHSYAIDLAGHGRTDRPTDGLFAWADFATDTLAVVDHLGLESAVGFGHSCGGATLLLAEQRRPGTFRSLYCFEPVLFPDEVHEAFVGDNPLSVSALRRRESFASRDEAITNFSSKPPFASLDPRALEAYVASGFELVPEADGGDGVAIQLRCRREDEAQVYRQGASHRGFLDLPLVTCPVTLACGAETTSFGPTFLAADAERLAHPTIEVLEAMGHFGPVERPDVVARSVVAHHAR